MAETAKSKKSMNSNTETFQPSDLTKDRSTVIGQPLHIKRIIKDYTKVTATEENPFRFMNVMIMESHEIFWYNHLVGTVQLVYLHGYTHQDGTFEIFQYCAFRRISRTKIEVTGRFKKEHLDI